VVVDEEEEEEEDELEDDEEEEVEDVLEVVEVVEDVLDEEAVVEVVEELGVVVDSVVDGGWVDETVCDWVVLAFGEPEVRTKYPPTAATITTTTIAPIIAVLNAVRLPRANEGKRSDLWVLRLNFSITLRFGRLYTCDQPIHSGRDLEKSTRGPPVSKAAPPGGNRGATSN
jgi:hypothetical protein